MIIEIEKGKNYAPHGWTAMRLFKSDEDIKNGMVL